MFCIFIFFCSRTSLSSSRYVFYAIHHYQMFSKLGSVDHRLTRSTGDHVSAGNYFRRHFHFRSIGILKVHSFWLVDWWNFMGFRGSFPRASFSRNGGWQNTLCGSFKMKFWRQMSDVSVIVGQRSGADLAKIRLAHLLLLLNVAQTKFRMRKINLR